MLYAPSPSLNDGVLSTNVTFGFSGRSDRCSALSVTLAEERGLFSIMISTNYDSYTFILTRLLIHLSFELLIGVHHHCTIWCIICMPACLGWYITTCKAYQNLPPHRGRWHLVIADSAIKLYIDVSLMCASDHSPQIVLKKTEWWCLRFISVFDVILIGHIS